MREYVFLIEAFIGHVLYRTHSIASTPVCALAKLLAMKGSRYNKVKKTGLFRLETNGDVTKIINLSSTKLYRITRKYRLYDLMPSKREENENAVTNSISTENVRRNNR
jgi:hypothetical protein